MILALIGQFYLRLAGAPGKLEFLRNGMNIIDVLAVLPYYVELGMANMETRAGENIQGERVLQSVMMDNVTYRSIRINIIFRHWREGSCNELSSMT